MKLIDNKGRLFGLINYIDLVIVLVATLLAGGYLYYKSGDAVEKNFSENSEEEKVLTITYFVSEVKDVSVNNVEIGDMFRSFETNNIIGKVIDKKVENATITTTNEKGEVIESEIPNRYNILLTVEGKGIVTSEEIKIANEVIHVGKSTLIQNRMTRFLTTIYGIEY